MNQPPRDPSDDNPNGSDPGWRRIAVVVLVILSILFIAARITSRIENIMQANRRNMEMLKTASDLRAIGEAIRKYSNDSRGPFPRISFNIPTTFPSFEETSHDTLEKLLATEGITTAPSDSKSPIFEMKDFPATQTVAP